MRLQRTFTVLTVLTAKVEASKKFLLAPPLYGMVMCGVLPSNFTHLLWQSSNRPFTLVPGLQECHRNVRLPVRFVDLMAPHVICLICTIICALKLWRQSCWFLRHTWFSVIKPRNQGSMKISCFMNKSTQRWFFHDIA